MTKYQNNSIKTTDRVKPFIKMPDSGTKNTNVMAILCRM